MVRGINFDPIDMQGGRLPLALVLSCLSVFPLVETLEAMASYGTSKRFWRIDALGRRV